MISSERKSTTRSPYPNVLPRSPRRMSRQPPARSFEVMCTVLPGSRNWPFFTNTDRPVAAAASRRSVCRHRNAGIWR
jgi:hypothetical protein